MNNEKFLIINKSKTTVSKKQKALQEKSLERIQSGTAVSYIKQNPFIKFNFIPTTCILNMQGLLTFLPKESLDIIFQRIGFFVIVPKDINYF